MMTATEMRELTKNTKQAQAERALQTAKEWLENIAIPAMNQEAIKGFYHWIVKDFPIFNNKEMQEQVCQYAANKLDSNGYRFDTDKDGTKILAIFW